MIKSLDEYTAEVKKLNEKVELDRSTIHLWFRGQSEKQWGLIPSIFRKNGNSFFERELIRDFQLNSNKFLEKSPEYEIEWLFIMQHYSTPTRLLDWSESHLFALYFAVLDYRNNIDACVWAINPWSLNEYSFRQIIEYKNAGIKSVPTFKHPILRKYEKNISEPNINRFVEAKDPIALRPPRNTPRIIAQKGVFTIHGNSQKGLEMLVDELNESGEKIIIEKIIIDGNSKLSILKELYFAGITHSVLFPEIEALSKEISFRYSKQYFNSTDGHNHSGF
jgi:hypothetical protein